MKNEIKLLQEQKDEFEKMESVRLDYECQNARKTKLEQELSQMQKKNIDITTELGKSVKWLNLMTFLWISLDSIYVTYMFISEPNPNPNLNPNPKYRSSKITGDDCW